MKLENVYNLFDNDIPSVIKNFLELHDNVDLNEIKVLKDIFDKIDKYELIEKNTIYEDIIYVSLTLLPKVKKKKDFIDEEKINNINFLMTDIDTIEDGYYYKTLVTLIKNFNYIDYDEQIILNFLFYDLNDGIKKLSEVEKTKFLIK